MGPSNLDSEVLFGQMLLQQGLVRQQHIDECLAILREYASKGEEPPKLGEVLMHRGYLSFDQFQRTLRVSERTPLTVLEAARLSAPSAPAPEGEPFGKYVKVLKIGEGGMGQVWKAWDVELRRWVALKFLKGRDADESARFRREAQTAARLNHPNIAAIYEAGENFIAMQLVAGQTLVTHPRKDLRRLAEIMRSAAHAVHYAHQQGTIHRDLKPANIMVEKDRVFVMDFGLAKGMAVDGSVSVSGSIVGTPAYMSPEQARGGFAVDHRADVYSLGATFYELLTDRTPFRDPNVYDLLKKVVERDPKAIRLYSPQTDRDLETIVMKCMEKDPARRYATAQDLGDDLGRWLAGDPILAHPPSLFYRFRKRVARNPWAWGLAATGLLALLGGTAVVVTILSGARSEQRTTELMRKAERLYEAGEYEKARVLTDEALAIRPGDTEARYWRARLLIRTYQTLRGVPEARVVRGWVDLVPPRPETSQERELREEAMESLQGQSLAMAQGILALWSGRFRDAISRFGEVPPDAPGAWEAEFYCGIAFYLSGDFEKAVELLSKHRIRDAAATLPVYIRALIAKAQRMDLQGKDSAGTYTQARAACEELKSPTALMLEAILLVAWGKAEATVGEDPEPKYARAIELVKGLDRLEALEARGDALLARADYRRSRGRLPLLDPPDYQQAIEVLGRLIEKDESYGPGYLRRAEAYLARANYLGSIGRSTHEDFERVRDEYEKALRWTPRYPDAAIGRALAVWKLEIWGWPGLERFVAGFDDLIKALGAVIESNPGYAPAWEARGHARLQRVSSLMHMGGDPAADAEAADADFAGALRINPRSGVAHRYRGAVHQNLGIWVAGRGANPQEHYESALREYALALEINPKDVTAYRFRGGTLQNLASSRANRGLDPKKELEDAIECFTQALAINPKDFEVLAMRAGARQNWGSHRKNLGGDPTKDYEEALGDYNRALEINGKEPSLFRDRAMTLQNRGVWRASRGLNPMDDYTAAIGDLETSIDVNPADPESYRSLALLKMNVGRWRSEHDLDPTGEYQEAIDGFDHAIKINARDGPAHRDRGLVKLNLGSWAMRGGSDPSKDYAEAIADFAEAIEINPKDWEAYRTRGIARQNFGVWLAQEGKDPSKEYEGAIEDLRRALDHNPKDAEAFKIRGVVHQNLGYLRQEQGGNPVADYDAAIDDLTRSVQINPQDGEAYCSRGITRYLLFKLEKDETRREALRRDARADLEHAIELNKELRASAAPWLEKLK